jgi:enoyl-CoA hydratase/carnithine racemase
MTEITVDTGTSELLCAIRDRVAVITLNRPAVRNALSDDLTPALRSMIKSCGDNPEVGALLITGAGTAFCAGGNVKGMGSHRERKSSKCPTRRKSPTCRNVSASSPAR